MSMSVKYDDVELNTMIDVEVGFNPLEGADWHRDLVGVGNANGSNLVSSIFGHKVITMPYRMKGNVRSNYDKLQKVLNSKEPKKLIFGSIPNRYYMAVSSGTSDFKEVSAGFLGHGTITWIVPSGVSESIDTKIVPVQLVNGILTANIDYAGSADAFPIFRIKHNDENGYVGIASPDGSMELGKKEEADGKNYQRNEVLADTNIFSGTGWSDWSGLYAPDPRFDLTGELSVSGDGRRKGLSLTTVGGNTGLFNGGGKVYTLQKDSEGIAGARDFYMWWDTFFWAGAMGQTGIQDIVFWSGNEIVARWYVLKTDKSGNSASCRAFFNDGSGNLAQVYDFGFESSHVNSVNPYSEAAGAMDFLKEGGKLKFHYFGRFFEVNVPYFAEKSITKVSFVCANLEKRTGDKYISFNMLRSLRISKLKVNKWMDVPNRYPKGSELVSDSNSGEIFLNGLASNNEFIDGSKFLKITPGQNKIEFYVSSWIKSNPTITVEYKERWL